MKFRLINLDRSSERLATFRRRNAHVEHIQRVSAVDGSKADRARLIANDVITPDLAYTDGALGCALSHLVQWRDVIQSETPATIVEDDAVLAANFVAESERLLARLPDDWEYVMWGYNFDAKLSFDLLPGYSPAICDFDQDALRSSSARFGTETVESRLFKLYAGFGTVAYSISPRGARRLLQFCMPLRPMSVKYPGYPHSLPNTGIDNMAAVAWPGMSAYVAVPPLVVTDNDHASSTVQDVSPKYVTLRAAPQPPQPQHRCEPSEPQPTLAPDSNGKRRNLIVVRCGKNSLHWEWLEGADRNWDLILCPFEPIDARGFPSVLAPGQKWAGLLHYFEHDDAWRDYDYVCMPDDDIRADTETWNRFFNTCATLGAQLAAPALTPASHYSHLITMQNDSFAARATSFVEIMNPCMSQAFLRRAVPTLRLSKSGTGFGLDHLWPAMTGYQDIWIIDDTPVHHTRPVGTMRNRTLWAHALYDQRRIEDAGIKLIRNTFAGYTRDKRFLTNRDPEFGRLYAQGFDYIKQVHPARSFELLLLSTEPPPAPTHEMLATIDKSIAALDRNPMPFSRGKPSRVSSVCSTSWSDDPGVEASGGNDGRLSGRSGFQTAEEFEPWWEVDLLGPCLVSSITIYNALDRVTRCVQFDLLTSMDGLTWETRYQKRDNVLFGGIDGSALTVALGPECSARYLRVRGVGLTSLQLDQVEVFAEPIGDDKQTAERVSARHEERARARLSPEPV